MMQRGQFNQALVAPATDTMRVMFYQWNDLPEKEWEYKAFAREETSQSAFDFFQEYAGIGAAIMTPENQATTFTDPIQGGMAIVVYLEYRTGTQVSNLMVADDRIGLVKQLPAMHQASHKFTREQTFWSTAFVNGFTSTTGCDGVSIYNSAHPLLGGPSATSVLPLPSSAYNTAGTYPNAFATPLAPSVSALTKMMQIQRRSVNGVGFPVGSKITRIVAPSEQEDAWLQIIGSAYDPNSGNNAVNTVTRFRLELFTGTYLTSTTNWFACGPKADTHYIFIERESVTDEYFDEPKVRGISMQVSQRIGTVVPYWYNTFGSAA